MEAQFIHVWEGDGEREVRRVSEQERAGGRREKRHGIKRDIIKRG
jgi:hypothetical protein